MSDTETNATATAHLSWDERWATESGRAEWLQPDPDVERIAAAVRDSGGATALDLGCGVGRHTLVLARLGFATCALDGSPAGLAYLEQVAGRSGLDVEVRLGEMTGLPYSDRAFDYVLAYNVIYHGDGDVVRRTIAEIRRVSRPRGTYQGTMLSKRNAKYGLGREVAPETFVLDDETDKAHPHFYCAAEELEGLFAGFRVTDLHEREHTRPGSWHWHLTAERLP